MAGRVKSPGSCESTKTVHTRQVKKTCACFRVSQSAKTVPNKATRPWSRLGLVQFFETETVLVSEGPIPRYVQYGGK
jgi:hypothetical protein